MSKYLEAIARRSEAHSTIEPGDYEKDGILYCGKCHTPKQIRLRFAEDQAEQVVGCLCRCAKDRRDQEDLQRRKRERAEKYRDEAFGDKTMLTWTFDKDDGKNQKTIEVMKKYVENFERFSASGKGILLHGENSRGKSFAAACVVNELVSQGIRCRMDKLTAIANKISSIKIGKQDYIDNLNNYKLLVLDDLGAERDTPYMQEIIFSVIDGRADKRKPMIITTNLSMEDFQHPKSIMEERIFSRVLAACIPFQVVGKNRRVERATADYKGMKEILGI